MIDINLDLQAQLFRRKYVPAVINALYDKNAVTVREVQRETKASYGEAWKCLMALSRGDIVRKVRKTFVPNRRYLKSPGHIVLNPYDARISGLFRNRVVHSVMSALFARGPLDFGTLMEFTASDDMTLRRALAILIDTGLAVHRECVFSLHATRIAAVEDKLQYVPRLGVRAAVEAFLMNLHPEHKAMSIIVYGKASKGLTAKNIDLVCVVENTSNTDALVSLVKALRDISECVEKEHSVKFDITICSVLDWCNHILGYVCPPSIAIMRALYGIAVFGGPVEPRGEQYLHALSKGLTKTEFEVWVDKGYAEKAGESWRLTELGYALLAQKPPTRATEENIEGIRIITTVESLA